MRISSLRLTTPADRSMRTWSAGIILSLGLAMALAAGGSCTTIYDQEFQLYRMRCSDGRQFKSVYDKDFDRWRTRELPPWKPAEKKGGKH